MSPRAPIVVALSGGVDSAVCAGLLVEAGEEVIGISMRLHSEEGRGTAKGRCCGPADLEDARAVCMHLGIPFYVVDYEETFARQVMDDFVTSYQEGRTPNPCVRCNQHIKFTPLMQQARALGAQALATGHYARLTRDASGQMQLLRAVDEQKDQSYFLFAMPSEDLDYVRFPLGALRKEEVRAHARRLGLPNADKAESQEICFVPDGDYAKFVEAWGGRKPESGALVDAEGQVVGQHNGIHHFTIGQRRGLGGSFGNGTPRYVVRIEALTRKVHIGEKKDLSQSEALLEQLHWLTRRPQAGDAIEASVQIRYRRAPQPARIEVQAEDRVRVSFHAPEHSITPGQAAVIYQGDTVLGGGFIAADRV